MSNKPVRLPNLQRLKVKSSVVQDRGGPCMVVMTNLLNCWASNAHGSKECQGLEQDLKTCMATKVCFIQYFLFHRSRFTN